MFPSDIFYSSDKKPRTVSLNLKNAASYVKSRYFSSKSFPIKTAFSAEAKARGLTTRSVFFLCQNLASKGEEKMFSCQKTGSLQQEVKERRLWQRFDCDPYET